MGDRMKILFYRWNSIIEDEIGKCFDKLGFDVKNFNGKLNVKESGEEELVSLVKEIKNGGFSHVFSVDFKPIVSKAVDLAGGKLIYISWNLTMPFDLSELAGLSYDFNKAFFYDRNYVEKLHKKGYKNTYHLPLATSIRPVANNSPCYIHDFSMVASMYESDSLNLLSSVNKYLKGYIDGLVEFQRKLQGGNIIESCLADDIVEDINTCLMKKTDMGAFTKLSKSDIALCLSREVTRRERMKAFLLLENKVGTAIYSKDKVKGLDNTFMGGEISYDKTPDIYRNSKVNLNISFSGIESGIPLRVLDIIGCGGLVCSNPQPEIFEYFTPNESIVTFDSIEELMDKVIFLVNNDTVRNEIINEGMNIIKKAFSYEDRINHMFSL